MPRIRSRKANRNLAEEAYNAIRRAILRGDLPIGSELSRRKLAAEINTSPIPIMEALQRLENEGLVESRPRVGTRVRVPTTQDIRERFILREALEAQSARMFSEKASGQEKREILRMARELDLFDRKIVDSPADDRGALIRDENGLHMRLHVRIAECTGCGALVNALELNQTLVFKWLLDMGHRLDFPVSWHEQLIEAISVSDPDAAEAAMRRHVQHGLENVLSSMHSWDFDDSHAWPNGKTRGLSFPRVSQF